MRCTLKKLLSDSNTSEDLFRPFVENRRLLLRKS